jgi:hypothetical protein
MGTGWKLPVFIREEGSWGKVVRANTQTPGKYPEDNLSLQHGESLKTRVTTLFKIVKACFTIPNVRHCGVTDFMCSDLYTRFCKNPSEF